MDGVPILDYTPEGLLGLVVILILFGRLVPWTVVKQDRARTAFLEEENKQLRAIVEEEQKTGKVVRHFFEGLSDR